MTLSQPDPTASRKPRTLLAELESMARQSDDAAAACQAIYDRHWPEFSALTEKEASAEDHERLLELYGHVFPNRDQAERMRGEGEVLRKAIAKLKRYEEALQEISEITAGYGDPFQACPSIAREALCGDDE